MIKKHYLTQNDCYKQGRKMNIVGLMLHSVGCNVEDPMRFISSWNAPNIEKCVHTFIGRNDIYETLPHNYRGWHCGVGVNGSYNNGYIGVELCEPRTIHYTSGSSYVDTDSKYTKDFVLATYMQAVMYFSHLCKLYNLNPLGKNVIVSHSEAHTLGYASDHGDVEHIWRYVGLSMDTFRLDVKNAKSKVEYKSKQKAENTNAIITEKMLVNEKLVDIHTVKKDNYNYVRLDDLKKQGLCVSYDKTNKQVNIKF